MKRRIWMILPALLAVFLAVGCQKEDGNRAGRETEFKKLGLEKLLGTVGAGAFAVSDDGELFLSENYEKICRYSADGELLDTYGEAENAEALCLMGEQLFAYTDDNQLLRISLKDGKTEILAEDFPSVQDVVNLVACGGSLYAHVRDDELDSCLKRVSAKTGAVEDVELADGELRAVYASADGHLYYCVGQNGGTFLYEYEEDRGGSSLCCDLTNRLEAYSAVLAFVCEQGMFLYTTPNQEMRVFSLEEEHYAAIPMDSVLAFGRDLACAAGNVVYRTFAAGVGEAGLHTVYLGDVELKPVETGGLEGTITLWKSSGYDQLDTKRIREATGLRTELKNIEDNDAFLADLMAGNPDVDIFMVSITDARFRREGLYEPLNSSSVIQAYQNACFPYISEGMQTGSGDIWMLPVAVGMDCTWYVEENLEKFGVDPERLRTMDSFLELSKEMKKRLPGTGYYTYATVQSLGNLWSDQYTRVYCDVPQGVVNYKTDLYRSFFDAVWSGWNIYAQAPEHPYIERQRAEEFDGMVYDAPYYHPEKMLYKYDGVGQHLEYGGLEGWRVMPAPKFSEEVQGDEVRGVALVLNPHSRQKELAMAYLEAVARDPVGIYESQWYTSFLFSDRSVYRESYDVGLPAFQDLYELFAGGTVNPYPSGYPYYFMIVDEYQTGRLTLDEALDKLQREMDMYLNE